MFKGMIVATVTPMGADGEVDFNAYERHVEWLVQEGVDGIVCFGTTGEAPTLSDEEKEKLLRLTVAICKGTVPIIAGTGCYDTRATCAATKEAMQLGADGALIIVPYYNRPTPQGCIAHFQAIAKIGLPLIPYHHPARTGVRLSADTLVEICEIPEVVAVKEGPGDVDLTMELARRTTKTILTGDDLTVVPCMSVGAKGVISVMGNLIPTIWKSIVDLYAAGKSEEALDLYRQYIPLTRAVFVETNPIGAKYAMSVLGKCTPHLRLPLMEPTQQNKLLIEEMLNATILRV